MSLSTSCLADVLAEHCTLLEELNLSGLRSLKDLEVLCILRACRMLSSIWLEQAVRLTDAAFTTLTTSESRHTEPWFWARPNMLSQQMILSVRLHSAYSMSI
jgi:hypothetical protein